MAGSNPYIKTTPMPLPTQKYKMHFQPMNVTVEVDPDELKEAREGELGSILDIAVRHGIDIDHSCGGVCACSTCHVFVKEGGDTLNEASDDEEDMLDLAPGLTAQSRLACQSVPNGTQDVVVEVPGWNRNLVSEQH